MDITQDQVADAEKAIVEGILARDGWGGKGEVKAMKRLEYKREILVLLHWSEMRTDWWTGHSPCTSSLFFKSN